MEYIYGINPVREALLSGRRGCREIFILNGKRDKAVRLIERLAGKSGIDIKASDKALLSRLSNTTRHQGVVALVEDYSYSSPDAAGGSLIVADGVQDPRNLGAIIRSAYLLGLACVVIPERGAAGVTPTVVKASAGATERMPIAAVPNINSFIRLCKEKGYLVAALDGSGRDELCAAELREPIALVVGGEGHGIRNKALELADIIVRIPILAGGIDSYNVSVASAIAMYEILRQKKCRNT